jgi:purine-nucleoside phosphorylase
MREERDRVAAAATFLGDRIGGVPAVAIVLGSGLGGLAESILDAVVVPYATIPGFPEVTVAGHGGQLIAGQLSGVHVAAMQGRFHLYEGHSADAVVRPVRALARLGVASLVVTNSAGGLDPRMQPGDLMLIDDHINLMFANPLMGPVMPGEARFPDMSSPYDRELLEVAERIALRHRIPVRRGVYCAVHGPSYETPAEIRMVQRLGADATGMSTVPEVIAARACGMRVLGVSIISNLGAGLSPGTLSHEDVLAAGRTAAIPLTLLLSAVIADAFGSAAGRADRRSSVPERAFNGGA